MVESIQRECVSTASEHCAHAVVVLSLAPYPPSFAGRALPRFPETTAAYVRKRISDAGLDPLVRLHRSDESSASDVALLLAYIRQLQRRFAVAIVLVHHLRKSPADQPGQTLRGSGDLHAWSDSSLYLVRRKGIELLVATGVLVETTSKKRDRSFVYRSYLDRLHVGAELDGAQVFGR